MATDTLYEEVKERICEKIFEGSFAEDELIPAERTLSEMLGVSRITVRKSLDLLAEQGLVCREVGRGTRIQLPNKGTPSDMEMVVLIASSQNPFFADFIHHVQKCGQNRDIMILYAEKPRREKLENSIFRFYSRKLRNIIVWPEKEEVDLTMLKRLRALGMNMVFFDTDAGLPYADCVSLNNEKAAHEICEEVRKLRRADSGQTEPVRIGYIGWQDGPAYSTTNREAAFLGKEKAELLLRIPWSERENASAIIEAYLRANREKLPKAIAAADQECGNAAAKALRNAEISDCVIGSIDDLQESRNVRTVTCRQNFNACADRIFECLERQNREPDWRSEMYCIDGIIEKNIVK